MESLRAEPADGTDELVGSLRDRMQHFRDFRFRREKNRSPRWWS